MDLTRYSATYVSCLKNEEAREFLASTGLPDVEGDFTPAESTADPVFTTDSSRSLLRIGYSSEGEGFFGVDCGNGEIFYVTLCNHEKFFVNSSPVLFSKSLIEFQKTLDALPSSGEYDDVEVRSASESLGSAIDRIDPPALLGEPGFWRSILDDIAIGTYCDDE